ncbi:dihydrolipoyl dehydrogenase (plasmid) [Iamia sp. SCSIO 61187]|uniref:dihydrolipoyl dehydrogenase n=1 Tax=Iamia sp. SCSIO 61187 TaxID=2722752 RepID=UPI001C62E398|nr:dihydrolipoyl dehydrogenase [Iamia sp. SCSIO 61187]QYG94364.1 dihydrolipoyl dehydrogenase [Iamia sp. SCSIO 61187]QYG95820.1 dihydrolipoyl dehydrogenase [Iamia sp. SCSIO 61187]
MTAAETFDVVVLGGGTGGYSCALRAADLGLRTAVVERDKVGGTCLHRGCIPAKALLQAAEVAEHAADAAHYGVRATFHGVDPVAVQRYKQRIVDTNHKGLQSTLRRRGVEVIAGTARMTNATTLDVDTADGLRRVAATRGLVLATGSAPRALPVEGLDVDGHRVITSDHALFLERVPERPIIIGASAVGVEFATIWKTFGARSVTVIEALPAVVPREDVDTSKALASALSKQGIDVRTGVSVVGADRSSDAVRVRLGDGTALEGDIVLVAIGRAPVSDGMGFSEAGVTLDRGYVGVNEWCETEAAGVYAIGDVIGRLGLAHSSFQEGFLVAERIAGRSVVPIDYAGTPRVYYCHPEVASVGLTEQQLTERGIPFQSQLHPFSHNARAMMTKASGHVKVLVGAEGGPVLGVHIVGPRATDIIGEAQLIYSWEALPTEVAQFIHPHPTLVEAIGEAHMAAAGRPLHG